MKRLALLVVSACMALVLSACGDNAEKKVDTNAANTVEQTDQSNTQLNDAAKDADSKLSDDTAKPADDNKQETPAPATDDNAKPAE